MKHAFPATCPHCNAPVLATNWDYTELMPTHNTHRADPTTITPTTETACIILGRETYNLHTRAGQPQLTTRDARWHKWHYHGPPEHILPAHHCGTHLPGTPYPLPEIPDQTDPNQLNLNPEPDTSPF